MTAPVRLLESSQNPALSELLRAGRRERPRSSARTATALALGISSSVVAASTTATAAAGTGAAALAAPSLAVSIVKWVAIGTLGGLTLAGTVTWTRNSARPARTTSHVGQPPTARTAGPLRPATRARETPASRIELAPRSDGSSDAEVTLTPSRPTRAKAAEPLTNGKPAAPASASLPAAPSLSREIALIDGARRRLSAGDAAGALRQLDDYAAAARTGTLDREAQLLRIDALMHSGERAAALPLVEHYLAIYPNDPHSARLRALVPATGP